MNVPEPTVRPTGWVPVVVGAVVGAGAAWLGLGLAERLAWPIPTIPVLTVVVVAVLAIAVWIAARRVHRAVQVARQPVEARRAVSLLLAAKTALIGGAALVGGYAAVAVRYLPLMDAERPRERVWVSALVAVCSAVVAWGGLALERALRVPPSSPDNSDLTEGDSEN